jgi:phytoene/squalene synthetase
MKLLQRNVLSGITRCTFHMAEVHTSVKRDLKKDLLRSKRDPIIGYLKDVAGALGVCTPPRADQAQQRHGSHAIKAHML